MRKETYLQKHYGDKNYSPQTRSRGWYFAEPKIDDTLASYVFPRVAAGLVFMFIAIILALASGA